MEKHFFEVADIVDVDEEAVQPVDVVEEVKSIRTETLKRTAKA